MSYIRFFRAASPPHFRFRFCQSKTTSTAPRLIGLPDNGKQLSKPVTCLGPKKRHAPSISRLAKDGFRNAMWPCRNCTHGWVSLLRSRTICKRISQMPFGRVRCMDFSSKEPPAQWNCQKRPPTSENVKKDHLPPRCRWSFLTFLSMGGLFWHFHWSRGPFCQKIHALRISIHHAFTQGRNWRVHYVLALLIGITGCIMNSKKIVLTATDFHHTV